jgi:antirestriction protein ArdC
VKKLSQNTRAQKVRQAKQNLNEAIEDLARQMEAGCSANLIRYLNFCAHFHHYSFGNLMLALAQRPDLTRIAGLRQWNKLGRRVKTGEHGIMILAPMTIHRKNDKQPEGEDDEDRMITLFKPVFVFDYAQTEGEAVPCLIQAAGDAETCLPALKDAIQSAGITLETVPYIPGAPGALGASHGGRIRIRDDLTSADAFRTLAHEYCHELMHFGREKESHVVRETEADAAAYVVCQHFGIECDTSDYLLLHHAEPKTLLERLETIRQTASRIIDAIQAQLEDAGVEVKEVALAA